MQCTAYMLDPGKMASEATKAGCAAFSSIPFAHSIATRLPAVLRLPQRSASTLVAAKRSPKRLKYSSQRLFKSGDEMIYVEMDSAGADTWKLEPVVQLIKNGAVGVIPTDTV
ncbi:hypothetical protein KSP39_PZI022040 [Platanthera zijinensis]|uniref:Uncharacterized protein n=1 Tax=Platanthera zijinensis TaxID=2320716 RepID=A0AAP0AYF7_9ASPA